MERSTLINGIPLHFSDSGESKPAIVFIHAFPFDSEMWKAQCAALKGHFRTITFDIRGFGQTQPKDPFYMIDDVVDDCIHLLDKLKLPQAILCGLSLGGYVALRAVETAPERVSGLVLCDTRAEADSNEAKTRRARQLRQLRTGRFESFARGMLTNVLAPGAATDLVESLHKKIVSRDLSTLASTLLALAARTDSTEALAQIQVPTLVMAGELDALTPPDVARSLQERIKNAELAIIPKAGHLPNLENTAVFNQNLLSFLNKHFS